MAKYLIGDISFHVSPVSIMQCWVGIGWSARGSAKEIEEFQTFTNSFFPFIIAQDCEEGISSFCSVAVAEIDRIIRECELTTNFLLGFAKRLKGRLVTDNQHQVNFLSEKYNEKVEKWLNSSIGQCGKTAADHIKHWGLQPPYRSLAAIGTFGNAIFGKYVNDLNAVCVQLDIIDQTDAPEVQFLETLLHEGIHAAIHREMGVDDGRPELTWMNELCAVLTSQEALRVSAKKFLDDEDRAKLDASLDRIRSNQQYGELAKAVFQDTGDALITLKAWKKIFALPPEEQRNYARSRVIEPILHDLGWDVNFPYHYGQKYVTVFI